MVPENLLLRIDRKQPDDLGVADATVDRILERGRLLRLDGPSIRRKHLPTSELGGEDQPQPTGSRVSGTGAAEFPERTSLSWT
jgi:hypothetical protein